MEQDNLKIQGYPKFSVLCSVYYKENHLWLRSAIDSIYNQTVKPSQVVLVEDGPLTIELYEEIQKLKFEYKDLEVVKLEKNSGLAIALNEGLNNCRYNLVARMDTDDISVPNRFEKQLEEMKKNPELALIGSNVIEFFDDINNIISKKNVPSKYEEILEYSKRRNPFNHMTVMFKKDKIQNVGGYIHSLYTEDYYLWIRVMRKYKCKNLKECLVYARTGDIMFSKRGGVNYIKSDFQLQKKMYKLKHISALQMIQNIIIRTCIRIVPNNIRKKIYLMKLRNNM